MRTAQAEAAQTYAAEPSSDFQPTQTAVFGRNEIVIALAVGLFLAVFMSWPLVVHLDRDIPDLEFGDPYLQAWQVGWGGHALANQPLDYFDSNTFWPLDNSLAFSDALIGYAPAGLFVDGPESALVAYNLLFLFAYLLPFIGAYLLARELGVGPLAAMVAGAAFAYAPWRLSQNTHMHVISSGGIPLTLFFLARGYRNRDPKLIVTGWLVATWQVSLGFTLGLQLGYLLGVLALVAVAGWLSRARPRPSTRVIVATSVGFLVFVGWTAVQARPYLQVVAQHPQVRRTVEEVTFFSPPPTGFLAVPEENFLWAARTASIRANLSWHTEQTLFPGVFITGIAIVGVFASIFPRRLRGALVVAVAVSAFLSLGFRVPGGEFAYGFLYDHLPGWQGIRTPGRLTTLTTLALAMLAAAGGQRLLQPAPPQRLKGSKVASVGVTTIIVAAVFFEGTGGVPFTTVPPRPAAVEGVAAPQLHLPSDSFRDLLYMFWSTDSFAPIANGHSGFVPESLTLLREATVHFPDPSSVSYLQAAGIRSVILHLDLAEGTAWEGAGSRPIEGLPLSREVVGRTVIYRLEPTSL